MADPVATLAALAVEAAIGYPRPLYRWIRHPVDWIAGFINAVERRWNRPERREAARCAVGIAMLGALGLMVGSVAWGLERAARDHLDAAAGVAVVALIASTGLAQRSLFGHVAAVAAPLDAGRLNEARGAVAMIVGRDTDLLGASSVAAAAIESLAESFCDGIVAPAFWLLVGGLPGLFVYKAVNTADSLVGHREERWRAFGWASARTDDLMNFIPARIAGVLVCLAGRGGWLTMVREARRHASPNAGWPEAAMAGALDVELGGPAAYDGEPVERPRFNAGGATPDAGSLRRALWLYLRACGLLWLLIGGLAWAL
jgi:adenosylcobinamide-phosphate synthase